MLAPVTRKVWVRPASLPEPSAKFNRAAAEIARSNTNIYIYIYNYNEQIYIYIYIYIYILYMYIYIYEQIELSMSPLLDCVMLSTTASGRIRIRSETACSHDHYHNHDLPQHRHHNNSSNDDKKMINFNSLIISPGTETNTGVMRVTILILLVAASGSVASCSKRVALSQHVWRTDGDAAIINDSECAAPPPKSAEDGNPGKWWVLSREL